MFEVLFSVTF